MVRPHAVGLLGACLAALLLTLAPAATRAQESRAPLLQWTRARDALGCIDGHTLALRVETLTGPRLGAPRDSNYTIEGHVAREGRGFAATVRVVGAPGGEHRERTLRHEDADCRGFDEALVFVVALMIDPELDLSALVAPPARDPGGALLDELDTVPAREPPVRAVVRAEPASPEPPPAADTRPAWRVVGQLGTSAFDTPAPLLHVAASGRRALGKVLRLGLGAQLDGALVRRSAGRAELSLLRPGVAVGLCAERTRRADTFDGCVHFAPEIWLGVGHGFDHDELAYALRVGFALEAAWSHLLGRRTALGLGALARLQTRPVRFGYVAGGETERALDGGVLRASIFLRLTWDARS